MTKRNGVFHHPDEPPPGGPAVVPAAPAAPSAPPAAPAAPAAPAVPAAPAAAPAAAPPAADPAAEWRATFGDTVKPADVLAKLREQHAKLQVPPVAPTAPAAAPPTPPPDIKDLIFDNPEQALDIYFEKRVGPVVRDFYETSANVTKQLVQQQRSDKGELTMPYFQRFERQIDEFVSKVHPTLRNRPETYQTAYNFVVGQNVNAIVQEKMASQTPPVEPAGGGPAAEVAKFKLTEEEAAVAVAMGMTPEEYAQNK